MDEKTLNNMAQGLEVLQAALSGKRVRCRPGPEASWRGWYRWYGDHLGTEANINDECRLTLREYWTWEWEIGASALMPFAEAVAAMRAGAVLTYRAGDVWFRRKGDEYEYRHRDDTEWLPAGFNAGEMDATDWRIVTEPEPEDGRPTLREAVNYAYDTLQSPSGDGSGKVLATLHRRWPAMFRTEGADA